MIFKTTLQTITEKVKNINKISSAAYIGTNGLFDTGTVNAYTKELQGLSLVQAKATLSAAKLTKSQQLQILSSFKASTATKALTTSQIEESLAKQLNNTEDAKAITQKLIKTGIISAEEAETNILTAEILNQAIVEGILTKTEAANIATALGLTNVNGKLAISFNALSATIATASKQILVFLGTTPIGLLILTGTALYGTTKAIDYFTISTKEAMESLKNTTQIFSETTDEINSLNEQLKTAAERINELERLEKDGTISIAEDEELQKLKEQNKEIQRQIALKKQKQIEDAKNVLTDLSNAKLKKPEDDIPFPLNFIYGKAAIIPISITDEADRTQEQYNKLLEQRNLFEEKEKQLLQKQKNGEFLTPQDIKEPQNMPKPFADFISFVKSDAGQLKLLGKYINSIDFLLDKKENYFEELYNEDVKSKISAYEALINAGIELNDTEQSDYDSLKSLEDLYLLHHYRVSKTAEAYMALNKEQKKSILLDKLKKNGYSDEQSQAIIDSINEEDLDNYYTSDFNFKLPDINDYNGDIKSWAKDFTIAWTNHVNNNIEAKKLSFDDAFNASDFSDSKEKLLELAKSGEITSSVLESTAEYKTLLTQTKLSAEEAKQKILDMLTATEKLSAASKGMDSLSTAFNEWQDKGFVTAETLETLPDVFKGDKDKFDLFSQIVGNPNNSKAQIQQAFNDIATEYLKTQGTLGKITEENTDSYIANLKDMGIANAEEVVTEYKASKNEFDTLLSEAYEEWQTHLNDEGQALEAYLLATDTKNAELMNAFGEEYSTDYQNWLELLQKKKDAYDAYRAAVEGTLVQTSNELTDQVLNKGLMPILYAEYENQDKKIKELADGYSAKLASKFTSNTFDFTGSKDSSSSSSDKDTSQTYDWIETKIKRLNEALDTIKAKADNTYSSWTKRNTELANAISKTKDAIDLQSQAYTRYMQKADSVGLPEPYKTLVQKGAIDIGIIPDETPEDKIIKDKISDYQTWYEKAQECLKTQEDLNSELNQLNTQKFYNIKSEYDAVINRMQSAYDLLENQITLLSSSGNYDTLRSKQADIVNKLQSERNALQNNLNSSDIQQHTEQWYNLISQLDTLDSQILDAETALKNIDKLQFDNLKEAFDFDTSVIEHALQTIQNKVDLLELKGQFANESYYNGMIKYTQKQLDTLKNERTQLQSILNNTLHKQGTAEWNDMYSTLMDIDKEIDSMTNNLVDFNNTIRDLNWEIFEYLEESLNRITEETDYYVELMSKKHLFDENGQITNYGTASMALHAAAYDVYKQQAQDYYEEVQDLQKQLINGAGDEVLAQYNEMVKAHQDAVLAAEDEKQSILDLIEDGYNAQLDALQRLIDKKKEQLNAEKNLYDYQKSIAEKTDNISSLEKQKLAYEGDTSEEAMSKIQQIRVQLEEAKADLKESEYEQYLSDTETMLDQLAEDYENWMNERLDHSDELIAQIISQISSQGDTINATLKETSDYYGTFISDSLSTIFSSDSPFTQSLTDGLNNVSNSLNNGLGGVSTSVNRVSTSIAGTTTAINNLVSHVANLVNADEKKTNAGSNVAANNNGNHNTGSLTNPYNPIINPVVNNPSNNTGNSNKNTSNNTVSNSKPTNSSSTSSSSNTSKTGKSLLDSILISKKDYYPKNSLNIDTSVVDRLKYYDKDSSFSARAMYWSKIFGGAYTGSPSQNTKLLNYLKSNGYKSGTSNAARGYHWTQEDGDEIIYRTADGAVLTPLSSGDMVFDNESSRRLWELSQNPEAYMKKYNIDPASITATIPKPTLNFSVPDFGSMANSQSSQVNVGDINVNLELPNVTDYSGFRNQLIKDNTFEKAVFTSINHALTGKGTPLDKLRHTR